MKFAGFMIGVALAYPSIVSSLTIGHRNACSVGSWVGCKRAQTQLNYSPYLKSLSSPSKNDKKKEQEHEEETIEIMNNGNELKRGGYLYNLKSSNSDNKQSYNGYSSNNYLDNLNNYNNIPTILENPELDESKAVIVDEECVVQEELSETQTLMQKVKDSGTAGIISYAFWELGFWAVSVPVCAFGFKEVTGNWPDLNDPEDLQKLGAEAFAFVNFARFAVPLRIGLALSTAPWIKDNIVDKFSAKSEPNYCEDDPVE